MKIRKAVRADAPAIHVLVQSYEGVLLQDHLPRISEFFVAVEGKDVVGCCALVVYSKRLAEIRTLAVAKDFQGKGIATKLVSACVKRAEKREVYEVLTITGVKELFEKQGFGMLRKEKYALLKVLKD